MGNIRKYLCTVVFRIRSWATGSTVLEILYIRENLPTYIHSSDIHGK
jgi:hypothetical protein